MKRMGMLLLACLLAVLLLTGCGGDVRHVNRIVGTSTFYGTREIERAMDAVCDYFQSGFDGCTLETLVYNEAETGAAAREWAETYDARDCLVFTSRFTTGEKMEGSLAPGSTCEGWQWIVVKEDWTGWKVKNAGFG